jgi:hypothetical protein
MTFTEKYNRDLHQRTSLSCLFTEDPYKRVCPSGVIDVVLCGHAARRDGEYNQRNAQYGCRVELKEDFEDMWGSHTKGASILCRGTGPLAAPTGG